MREREGQLLDELEAKEAELHVLRTDLEENVRAQRAEQVRPNPAPCVPQTGARQPALRRVASPVCCSEGRRDCTQSHAVWLRDVVSVLCSVYGSVGSVWRAVVEAVWGLEGPVVCRRWRTRDGEGRSWSRSGTRCAAALPSGTRPWRS